DRLREVLLSGKWIANTNYKDQLSLINWEQATQKIASLNTIAALTYHIGYYLAGVLEAMQGGGLNIRDKFSFDLPPIESKEDWEKLRDEFLTTAEKFAQAVETLSDAQLEEVFIDEKYGSYRRNIEGMIEHAYYHLGQVSLIRKMVLEGSD
ncbi:MAG: DinB family protein, partial [Bacteroidota bacterium]